MIIFHEKKLVVVTPYKCGSTSLHSMLCSPDHGGVYTIGPQFDGCEIDKHTFEIPYAAKDYYVCVVVRDPVLRSVSLWTAYCKLNGWKSFEWWVDNELLHDPRNKPISRLIDDAKLSEPWGYWKLEYIQGVLAENGIYQDLPRLNEGPKIAIPDNCIGRVITWAVPDIQRFNY